ncbi:esterase-like activity of phytase family protein [Sphingomonas sp. MG17]|uniref:Esterase-like activity of phytase family protein n=1 Tax=Sphingomonas tagetis TaxID=2949092 RepID=A0A9X2KR73_9SPHN|nr:esterase-like activity of phytase family protein [Sphingomonas tagetis]MCP3732508.1 esterase-like activity of phytase family protein [Sphingomonas tagetis]
MKVQSVQRLNWRDPEICSLAFPAGTMKLRYGFGSGLARRPGDPTGHVWAIGDRGPNIKVRDAVRLYGLDHLLPLGKVEGAKIMPWLDVGPTLAELRVAGDDIELLRIMPLRHPEGQAVTGLPHPGGDHLQSEPVFDIDGKPIAADLFGLDTEGLVALSDGDFWIGDEFGPSLVRVDATGMVTVRLLPQERAGVAGQQALPAIAARRQLNRGFEALAISGDERFLYLAFQSPLAHPDQAAHRAARHVRIWRLDAKTGAVLAQHAYPLDRPESFARDMAAGDFGPSDIKVSELLWLPSDDLLVLERGSKTTKIYRCVMAASLLDRSHLELEARPTLEELSMADEPAAFPVLGKELLFTSDEHPEVAADVEGMALLSASELLLVTDNDFGVQGQETTFWRITLAAPT